MPTSSSLPLVLQHWQTWLLSGIVAYLFAVRKLRYRRRDLWLAKYPDRASFAKLTCDDAVKVERYLMETEFPSVISTSAFFALFKVST